MSLSHRIEIEESKGQFVGIHDPFSRQLAERAAGRAMRVALPDRREVCVVSIELLSVADIAESLKVGLIL